jgi:hypothetical protein
VRCGEVDPKVANAVGYLAALLLKAIAETETEDRTSSSRSEDKSHEYDHRAG